MITVINYANGIKFEKYQKINTLSAYLLGKADSVIEYKYESIPSKYIEKHSNIFNYERGNGLWLWKPYLIRETLKKMQENEWLLYCDSGSIFINKIKLIIDEVQKYNQTFITFEQPLSNRQFCKKEAFEILGIQDNNENQLWAGCILIKKNDINIELVEEWLRYCENEHLLSFRNFRPEIKECDDFIEHREDQSILTLLSIKNQITPFRDPSDYGEMPFMYFVHPKFKYNPKEYSNSKYPTILLCTRKTNPYIGVVKYFIKKTLKLLGVFYTEKHRVNKIMNAKKITYNV